MDKKGRNAWRLFLIGMAPQVLYLYYGFITSL